MRHRAVLKDDVYRALVEWKAADDVSLPLILQAWAEPSDYPTREQMAEAAYKARGWMHEIADAIVARLKADK